MKIKELTIKKGIKMSVNYNSVSTEAILVAEVDENENLEQVYHFLSERLERLIEDDVKEQLKQVV